MSQTRQNTPYSLPVDCEKGLTITSTTPPPNVIIVKQDDVVSQVLWTICKIVMIVIAIKAGIALFAVVSVMILAAWASHQPTMVA